MVKAMMIPPSIGATSAMPAAHREMIEYCNAVMEPWDGPAAITATDGRWVIAGLDRNGLRPLRYTVTENQLLVVGSETGMVKFGEAEIVEKGRVGPGQMIAVDLDHPRFYDNGAIMDSLAAPRAFRRMGEAHRGHRRPHQDRCAEPVLLSSEDLRRRQLAIGATLEELESILHPMVLDANEATGSMGDGHRRSPCCRIANRGLHCYFRQNLQPSHQPRRSTACVRRG